MLGVELPLVVQRHHVGHQMGRALVPVDRPADHVFLPVALLEPAQRLPEVGVLLFAGLALEPLGGAAHEVFQPDHRVLAALLRELVAQGLHDLARGRVAVLVLVGPAGVSVACLPRPVAVREGAADVAQRLELGCSQDGVGAHGAVSEMTAAVVLCSKCTKCTHYTLFHKVRSGLRPKRIYMD